jgi:hypothetical protein
MTRATGEAYRCEQCKKQFATKDGLATHKQNKHPETPNRSMEMEYWLIDCENADEHVTLAAISREDAIAEARNFYAGLGDGSTDQEGTLYAVIPGASPQDHNHNDGNHMIHGGVVAERVCDINYRKP